MATTRRKFIGGCSAAIAAMAGSAKVGKLTFADPGTTNGNVLVNIFLRGGWDSLNVLIPGGLNAGQDYFAYGSARPNLQIPLTGSTTGEGSDPAVELTAGGSGSMQRTIASGMYTSGNGNSLFAHPRLLYPSNGNAGNYPGALGEIWDDGNLAFVAAAGLNAGVVTRSHFDAMELIELGTNDLSSTSGWLARHLQSAQNLPPEALVTGAAVGTQSPTSLLGAPGTANFGEIGRFNLREGFSTWRPAMRTALRNIIEAGSTPNHTSGLDSLDAVDVIETATSDGYTPAPGVTYTGNLANSLKSVAQMIKLDLGLQVATIDYGGWDTHNGQGNAIGGSFGFNLENIRHALYNFYLDMSEGPNPLIDNITVVVQSEFGRRLIENADRGTDHGYGNLMLVMGGKVNGGVYGTWPGLQPGELYDNNDLLVTTDYRRVMTEILVRRLCNNDIDTVFPGYASQYEASGGPLGVVEGVDLPVTSSIFQDGFDSGNVSAWS